MEVHQYDKIVKENLEAIIEVIIQELLEISPQTISPLPEKLHQTKEREPDVLKRVTNREGEDFILHLEFQTVVDPEMVYRMHEYCTMLLRKYRLPVHQYVIYLGAKTPKFAQHLAYKNLYYRYDVLTLREVPFATFLLSPHPENIILTVLCNFEDKKPAEMVEQIIKRLAETSKGQLAFQKHFQQLRVLSKLRNLEDMTMAMLQHIEGVEKEKHGVVKNLLLLNVLTPEQIANVTNASLDLVMQIKDEQNSTNS